MLTTYLFFIFFIESDTHAKSRATTEGRVCSDSETCDQVKEKGGYPGFLTYQAECEEKLASDSCKQVYEKIEFAGKKSNDYKLTCSLDEFKDFVKVKFDKTTCAHGVFQSLIGSITETISESAAGIVIDAKFESECNSSIDRKKLLYIVFNAGVSKDLQVNTPSDDKLKHHSCAQIKKSITQTHRLNYIKQTREEGIPFDKSLELGFFKLIEDKLKELQIEVECYNPKKAEELKCEISTTILFSVTPVNIVRSTKARAGFVSEFAKVATNSSTKFWQKIKGAKLEKNVNRASEILNMKELEAEEIFRLIDKSPATVQDALVRKFKVQSPSQTARDLEDMRDLMRINGSCR